MAKLFSIKQEYCDKIYNNEKLVELRRQNIKLKVGEKCYIYTTSPRKTITGYFIVEKSVRIKIQDLWDLTKDICGVSKEFFFKYFEGKDLGTAIFFKKVKEFIQGVSLDVLRDFKENFMPPQSYFDFTELVEKLKKSNLIT